MSRKICGTIAAWGLGAWAALAGGADSADLVRVTVDAARRRPFRRVGAFTTFWNNRANPLPFGADSAEMRRFREAGFRMVRLVAFSESWLWGTRVERGEGGRLETDFADFDRILDLFTAAGAEPYIRLAYHVPAALAGGAGDSRNRYRPPEDPAAWDELMRRIVRHVRVERKLPVRYWVTALNEVDVPVRRGWARVEQVGPTLNGLYERTTRIVRSIDPNAKVGGPALAWTIGADGAPSPLFVSFLDFVRRRDLPLDFICFHAYARPHPREYERIAAAIAAEVRRRLPARAGKMEYFLDEWNLWRRDGRQDNEYAAAYLAAALHYQRRAGLTGSSIVSFNHFLPTACPARELASHTGPFEKAPDQAARFLPGRYTAEGVRREGILAHPPTPPGGHPGRAYTYGRYEVDVPATGRPRLRFATGLGIEPQKRMDGVSFGVVVAAGGEEREVFSAHQRRPRWVERTVPLDAFAGRRARVEFRTWSGPPGSSGLADWGVWAEPRLVVGSPERPTARFDFLRRAAAARTGARVEAYRFHYDDDTIRRYGGLPLIKGPVVTTPWFVWRMHNLLGPEAAAVKLPGRGGILDDDTGGLTATVAPGRVALLLWQFRPKAPGPRKWTVRLENLPEPLRACGRLRVVAYAVDRDHNNPYTKYIRNAADTNGGRYNLDSAALAPTRSWTVTAGRTATIPLEPDNLSVVLVEITPGGPAP